MTQSSSASRIPDYLRPYVVDQHWENYTPREHATWRFIMRQARELFRTRAHSIYLQGLEKTGIPITEIPKIEAMDAKLQELGWGAVCVSGFIPPLTFLDFQSRKLLPIAADMRSLEHIAYTPAPDIVHEAAGHAPILADPGFAAYLTNYAELARKAIFSYEDIKLYEAIRTLSDAKENPDSSPDDIAAAEAQLKSTTAAISWVSEAAQVARMNWWTAEYGLIGSTDHPQIYGAGLLSSLGEGENCLGPAVEKLPLSIACIEQSYDITRPQPQLFVARSFTQLSELLVELGKTMAFAVGGRQGLDLALRAHTVTTTVLDSRLEISGVLAASEALPDDSWYLRWQGPVQLSIAGSELPGHGTAYHHQGFSTPLGLWKAYPQRHPESLSDAELAALGLVPGQQGELVLSSGIHIAGTLRTRKRHEGKLVLLSWEHCTVRLEDRVLYQPDWGVFDQAIGCAIPSVYGGPADRAAFGAFYIGTPSSSPGRRSPFTAQERALFDRYRRCKDLRQHHTRQSAEEFATAHRQLCAEVMTEHPHEWLLGIELLELAHLSADGGQSFSWLKELDAAVLNPMQYISEVQHQIRVGKRLAAIRD